MKAYCVATLFFLLALLAGVAAFNYRVDPYVLFSFAEADQNRLSRIDQFPYLRVTKPWFLHEIDASSLVVGSSRSANITPGHASWGDDPA